MADSLGFRTLQVMVSKNTPGTSIKGRQTVQLRTVEVVQTDGYLSS